MTPSLKQCFFDDGEWSHPLLLMTCSLSHLKTLLTSYPSNKRLLHHVDKTLSHTRQISQSERFYPPLLPPPLWQHYLQLLLSTWMAWVSSSCAYLKICPLSFFFFHWNETIKSHTHTSLPSFFFFNDCLS